MAYARLCRSRSRYSFANIFLNVAHRVCVCRIRPTAPCCCWVLGVECLVFGGGSRNGECKYANAHRFAFRQQIFFFNYRFFVCLLLWEGVHRLPHCSFLPGDGATCGLVCFDGCVVCDASIGADFLGRNRANSVPPNLKQMPVID